MKCSASVLPRPPPKAARDVCCPAACAPRINKDYHDDPLEDLDDLPPMHERFGDLPRARIAPFPFAIGPGAGSEPGLMLGGPGGANALLEVLLGNHVSAANGNFPCEEFP